MGGTAPRRGRNAIERGPGRQCRRGRCSRNLVQASRHPVPQGDGQRPQSPGPDGSGRHPGTRAGIPQTPIPDHRAVAGHLSRHGSGPRRDRHLRPRCRSDTGVFGVCQSASAAGHECGHRRGANHRPGIRGLESAGRRAGRRSDPDAHRPGLARLRRAARLRNRRATGRHGFDGARGHALIVAHPGADREPHRRRFRDGNELCRGEPAGLGRRAGRDVQSGARAGARADTRRDLAVRDG